MPHVIPKALELLNPQDLSVVGVASCSSQIWYRNSSTVHECFGILHRKPEPETPKLEFVDHHTKPEL